MKRILLLVMSALFLSSSYAAESSNVQKYYVTNDIVIYYIVDNDEITITNGANEQSFSAKPVYTIKTISFDMVLEGGLPIVAIGGYALYDCKYVEEVTLPATVKTIGKYAFGACLKLAKVNLAEGSVLETIEDYGFYDTALTSFDFPESVTSIGIYAFSDADFTSVSLPKGITKVDRGTFYMCENLTSVDIPEGVTSIERLAFSCCVALPSIDIPDAVTTIGKWAFEWCYSLKSVELPASLTKLDEGAFGYCLSLASVLIPETCTTIGNSAFENCTNLHAIYIKGTNNKSATMPTFGTDVFKNIHSSCILYVPEGTADDYYSALNEYFDRDHIVELKSEEYPEVLPTDLLDALPTITSPDAYEIGRYNLQGQKLSGEQKGINIIKYSDGTTQKVLVK